MLLWSIAEDHCSVICKNRHKTSTFVINFVLGNAEKVLLWLTIGSVIPTPLSMIFLVSYFMALTDYKLSLQKQKNIETHLLTG